MGGANGLENLKGWEVGVGGYCINMFQIRYNMHIYFKYDIYQIRFYIIIFYILSTLYNIVLKKCILKKNWGGGGGGGGALGAPLNPPSYNLIEVCEIETYKNKSTLTMSY